MLLPALAGMQGDQMAEAATKQMGQLVDGKFRVRELVGRTERSSVFLTEYDGQQVKKAAIKLIPADSVDAPAQLARWKHAAKLSHPHLVRLLGMGRCELDHTDMLYVVMEYAEENLSLVIKRRPLTPEEARDLLGPVVDALAYVHANGFVHCRLKPSNIMADGDLLKISSDGLCRIGESSGSPGKPGAYDPPEAAGGRISPAGDVWSLGMTLTESLTQRLPVWERTNQAEPSLPSNLQPEILDLARHCLRRDPQMRWTVADIAARLQPNSPAPPKQIPLNPQPVFTNPRVIGVAVVAVLALVALIASPRLFKRPSRNQPVPIAAPDVTVKQATEQPAEHVPGQSPDQLPSQSSIQPSAQSKAQPSAPSPAQLETQPPAQSKVQPTPGKEPALSARPLRPPTTSANSSAPIPTPPQAPPSPNRGMVRGKVVQQVLPDAPQKARDTIRGKVRLRVKVNVDESGTVTQATLDAPGPSQYFAERTLKAAQLWKFTPTKVDGRKVASEWLLYFEIDPASTTVYPKQTTP